MKDHHLYAERPAPHPDDLQGWAYWRAFIKWIALPLIAATSLMALAYIWATGQTIAL